MKIKLLNFIIDNKWKPVFLFIVLISISISNAQTNCIISGPTSFCAGGSANLCGPVGSTNYQWSNGSSDQCITVSLAGTYSLTVTNPDGSISTCNQVVTVNALPSCTISGNPLICPGSTTPFCAPAGAASYLWSTNATTQCIDVSISAAYYVTVTGTNGCSQTCSKALNIRTPPSSAIGGGSSVCQGASIPLCAPSGKAAYLWNTGETTQCIAASSPTAYTVTVTGTSGCTSTSTKKIVPGLPPTCSISCNTNFICPNTPTELCGPHGSFNYLWSTGETTKCIIVNNAGTFIITITNTSGCVSTCKREFLPIDTDDHNACTIDACNSSNGKVTHIAINVDDQNVCTIDDCNSTTGVSHTPVNTDDQNACTIDDCNSITGVSHTPVNTNDNNACTTDDCIPSSGTITHTAVNINDNNVCTIDDCIPSSGIITHTAVNTNDNNACTIDDCSSTTGVSHTPVNTNDNNACTTDDCIPSSGTITHTAVNTNDNNVCTIDDCIPSSGIITHSAVNTDDSNACTTDDCNSTTGISHTPINTNDNNACTTDDCIPSSGVITHIAVNTDDGNACTTDDCNSSTGVSHTPVNTNDNNVCTIDDCIPSSGTITHTAVNTNDNNACTIDDCNSTTGVSHTAVNTDDNNACTIDDCVPSSGSITHTAVNTNDNNVCTIDDCNSTTGVSHTPINTDDNSACTIDDCNSVTGVSHTPVNTDDNNACTVDNCIPSTGTITHTAINIDDNNLCTIDACNTSSGIITHTDVNIDDNDVCTIDACNPATGVITHTPNGPPACSISGDNDLCQGTSATFTASSGSSYLWSTGETTPFITVSTAGTYTVTITNSSTCSSSCSRTLTYHTCGITLRKNPDRCEIPAGVATIVNFTYVVKNTSPSLSASGTLTDDNGTPGNTADDIFVCNWGPLAPGDSAICTHAFTLTGTFTSTGIATGSSGGTPVSATSSVTIAAISCNCNLSYPDNSNLPRSGVIFNESEVLKYSEPGPTSCGVIGSVIKLWYSDEHALLLGVRRVDVKTSNGISSTYYNVSPATALPSCLTNPLVGDTVSSGDQAGNDVADGGGRPLWPALFITDVTVNGLGSRVGDWQQGGVGVPPHKVCGTWKSAVKLVDKTKNPATVTITTDADPAQNKWDLGTGSDTPVGGFDDKKGEKYGAEAAWNTADLGLIPGHDYRLQFMVHDGDQNKSGGDVGETCTTIHMSDPNCEIGTSNPPSDTNKVCYTGTSHSSVKASQSWFYNITKNEYTIRTTFSKNFVDNTYGANAIGWPSGHTFSNLTGSDKVQLALYDGNGVLKMEFKIDYISASAAVPSGYQSLGVLGGEGGMITGNASDVVSATTSIDQNLNKFGYVLTSISPATNSNYIPDPLYPNWIYDVWYEVTVKGSVFGTAGLGRPLVTAVHASPSKTGSNTEIVKDTTCTSAYPRMIANETPSSLKILNAYPNPFNDYISIEFVTPREGNAEINITDIAGRKVESFAHASGTVYAGKGLTPGIYFVTVAQDGYTKVVKIVKRDIIEK